MSDHLVELSGDLGRQADQPLAFPWHLAWAPWGRWVLVNMLTGLVSMLLVIGLEPLRLLVWLERSSPFAGLFKDFQARLGLVRQAWNGAELLRMAELLPAMVGLVLYVALLLGIVFVIVGLISSGVQIWAVRRLLPTQRGWFIASLIGWGVSALNVALVLTVVFLATYLPSLSSFLIGGISGISGLSLVLGLFGAVAGATVGACQWRRVLRRQGMAARWWVIASAIGGAIAWGIAWAPVLTPATRGLVVLSGPAGGAVYGAVTGGLLLWLLRDRLPAERSAGV